MTALSTPLLLASSRVKAQNTYNWWTAQPAKLSQPINAKARQDSLRSVAYWAIEPLIKRGTGQRTRYEQSVAEDKRYLHFINRTVRYPPEALKAQTEGRVKYQLLIDEAGRVVKMILVQSTVPTEAIGEAAILQEAQRVFQQLRFEPAATVTQEEASIVFTIR